MPLPPSEKTLRHVLMISAIDGWSVTVFAGLCTVISLALGSWIGVGIGAIVTGAGLIELHGRNRLLRGESAGIGALVGAQLMILVTIVLYAAMNLLRYDEAALMAQITPEIRDALDRSRMSVGELRSMLKPLYFCLYLTVIGLTVLFQGGLALYYRSRRAKVVEALRARQSAPPPLPRT